MGEGGREGGRERATSPQLVTYSEKQSLNFAAQLASALPVSVEQLVGRDSGTSHSILASQHPHNHIRDTLLGLCVRESD